MNNQLHLAWLDLETGGLNGRLDNGKLGMEHYPIFEVAMIVTDADLNQVGLPLHIIIHQTEDRIAECSEWAIDTHTKSGLLDQVRESTISLEQAEAIIIDRLKSFGINEYNRKEKTGALLAGNSIMFDRSYIMCQMPTLNDYLHYRQLDVSAFNLAVHMLQPEIEERVVKECKHEALADIHESIEEYRVYVDALFQKRCKLKWKYHPDEECYTTLIGSWSMTFRLMATHYLAILTEARFTTQYRKEFDISSFARNEAESWALDLVKDKEEEWED